MSINKILYNRALVTNSYWRTKLMMHRVINCLGCCFVAGIVLFAREASAITYVDSYSDVSNGFSDCVYVDANAEYIRFELTVSFKAAQGHLNGQNNLIGRGVVVYRYDENGVLKITNSRFAEAMSLNGELSYSAIAGTNFFMYIGNSGVWANEKPFVAKIMFIVLKSDIAAWPAVGVRVGNVSGLIGEQRIFDTTGVAYISADSIGNCRVISSPENPPPPITPKVTMSAPDWDLGELPRGVTTALTLPATKDQLCFTYEGTTAITSQKYLINATNANGMSSDSRYLLRNLEDSSQTVPYDLALVNNTELVLLPNTLNRVFSLETAGRTCFTPSFWAQPDKAVKGGAYSDILTFTVVAKP